MLTGDPGMGVVRHADAGYPEAIGFGAEHGVDLPSLSGGAGAPSSPTAGS